MNNIPRALVYCDRAFSIADGKTAHGLVRYTTRFKVVSVVDSTVPEGDAGEILDGNYRGIPLYNDLQWAFDKTNPDVFVVGAVSEGGVLPEGYDKAIAWALRNGLDIVSGLHQFLSDDPKFSQLAEQNFCKITDVRKMFRDHRVFYTGKIKDVKAVRIAIIGTDSAVGKRTLAVKVVEELRSRGRKADMIFTGQTGWLQGWPHGVVMDALINDFVSGGIEGAILDSWNDDEPEFMIIEGQGSLVHPFFPGGFEILAAGQIHGFLLIDAPGRPHLDGFPGYPMPDPERVVKIAEMICEKHLVGVALNREKLDSGGLKAEKHRLGGIFKVPVEEPISDGVRAIADAIEAMG